MRRSHESLSSQRALGTLWTKGGRCHNRPRTGAGSAAARARPSSPVTWDFSAPETIAGRVNARSGEENQTTKRAGFPEPSASGNTARQDCCHPGTAAPPLIYLAAVNDVAGSARADRLPGGKGDGVTDEAHRAVGKTDIHAADVVTAGRDVSHGEGAPLPTVITLVVRGHRVRVLVHLGQGTIVFQAPVADDARRPIIPGVALVRVPLNECRGVRLVE